MSVEVLEVTLSPTPIFTSELAEKVRSHQCGAVVTFSGEIRDHDGGKTVEKLIYEIHPSSEAALQRVTHDVVSRYENLRCAVSHRYGEIPLGECALAIAVATPHRGDALRACEELINEIKAGVPIWKHQFFSDGTDEWVNCL